MKNDKLGREATNARWMEIYRELTPWWKRILYKILPAYAISPARPPVCHCIRTAWRNLVGHPREFLVTGVSQLKHEDAVELDGSGPFDLVQRLYIEESLDSDGEPYGPARLVDQDGNFVRLLYDPPSQEI